MGKVVRWDLLSKDRGETVGSLRKELRLKNSAHFQMNYRLSKPTARAASTANDTAVALIDGSVMNLHKEKTWRQKFS